MPSDHRADARVAREVFEDLVAAEAPRIAAGLPSGFGDAIERFVSLMLEANDRMNLTRVVHPAEVARLHLLDALSALPILDATSPSRAVDLGSGGGVPGIVLAIARPDVTWALNDSVRKKADVLRTMVADLGLADVEVLAERAEVVGHQPEWRGVVDLVTARACASLPVLVEYALPLLRTGGRLVAWKGRIGEEELAAGGRAASLLGGHQPAVVETDIAALGDHRFVIVDQRHPSPARFPRRAGEPSRHPLG